MKGDFSRLTFDHKNHYIGVRWQQGRPVTDADQNEAEDIATYRVETEAVDVIGRSGAPKENPGFGLSVDSAGGLQISAGHFYVDGILCENEADVAYINQPHRLDTPPLTTDFGTTSLGLIYIDVFKRLLTFRDNPAINDVALNGVDTTTRLQTIWQVRAMPLSSVTLAASALTTLINLAKEAETLTTQIAAATDEITRASLIRQRQTKQHDLTRTAQQLGVSCDGAYSEWGALDPPTGELAVSTVPTTGPTDPCEVPPGGGYSGENQFYTVQVHSVPAGGGRNGATFKWSRDNGSVLARIDAIVGVSGSGTGTVFSVDSVQHDDYLGIHNNDWVEFTDDSHELSRQSGTLARVVTADTNLNRLTLDRNLTVNLARHPKLRKWDQVGASATATGVAMNTTNTPILLEQGIQVEFTDGTFSPGDSWHFSARAVSGQLDFPATAQPPFSVKHHYARLGIVAFEGIGTPASQLHILLDCRNHFPPLTAITASDVSFDNTVCNFPDVSTVQEAIEQLCARSCDGGTCTYTVTPGPDWWTVFDKIRNVGDDVGDNEVDAEICFSVGRYDLPDAVLVEGKGNLKLTGAGLGTLIRAPKAETALHFKDCASVTIRDLAVTTGRAGSGEELDSLQGALTFENCSMVTLDSLLLRCGTAVVRSAACLRVINDNKFGDLRTVQGTVDVRNCRFDVGSSQIGALVINGARVRFENNTFHCIDGRRRLDRIEDGLAENPQLRAEVRRVILRAVRDARDETRIDDDEVVLPMANMRIVVLTDPRLKEINFWQQIERLFSPDNVRDMPMAHDYLQDAVDSVLLRPQTIDGFDEYFRRLLAEDAPALYQGITIGGEEAEEVRIVDNTIIAALQGIHIGQSERTPIDQDPQILRSTVVHITGNTVYSRITPAINREAYGIYVGNCDSLCIENNVLDREAIESTAHMVMDGVHIVGQLGKRAIVRHNSTERYRFGVYIDPQSTYKQPLWMVADNVASVRATDSRVQDTNNLP